MKKKKWSKIQTIQRDIVTALQSYCILDFSMEVFIFTGNRVVLYCVFLPIKIDKMLFNNTTLLY